jgi:hypothetical protein
MGEKDGRKAEEEEGGGGVSRMSLYDETGRSPTSVPRVQSY